MSVVKIVVSQAYDGFSIDIGENHWWFNQEDTVEGLVGVFTALGYEDVEFVEDC